ncbi:MAG: PilZ domain-containing protein [Candidatus Omnitrophica bacterium]|nr:PilZ domain-containing protein [Candidatus Omnitrophota bacterium]
MADKYSGQERREFFRYRHEKPMHYKVVSAAKGAGSASDLVDADSKNLSVSGILFTAKEAPELSSVVMLDLDYRTSQICREIEAHALIKDNKLFGKVVRIEDAGDGLYDIGVAFLKNTERPPKV